jgi:predicted nucleic acid-binding protein
MVRGCNVAKPDLSVQGACVVDTNAVVYFLNQAGGETFRQRFERAVRGGAVMSVVTRIEVLGWPGFSDRPDALLVAEQLMSALREEPVTDPIVTATIAIRRLHRLKVPDALIAATAQVLGLPLMTHNLSDFRRVPGLILIDPLAA